MAEALVCPDCGARTGVPIVWGMMLADDVKRTDVVFGGCVVPADPPDHRCRVCDHSWRTP